MPAKIRFWQIIMVSLKILQDCQLTITCKVVTKMVVMLGIAVLFGVVLLLLWNIFILRQSKCFAVCCFIFLCLHHQRYHMLMSATDVCMCGCVSLCHDSRSSDEPGEATARTHETFCM